MRSAVPVLACLLAAACSRPGEVPEPAPVPAPEARAPAEEAPEGPAQPQAREQKAEDPVYHHIRAGIEDARDKDGRPVLRVRGTTDLPDGAFLSMHCFYDRIELGRHFLYLGACPREGAFCVDFPVYKERNFPGRHIVRIAFLHLTQHPDVQRGMKGPPRDYECVAELTIGTPEEIEKARRETRLRLAKEFERFDEMAGEVLELFEAQLAKPDPAAWRERVEGWEREIRRIQRRNVAVAEYKAVGLLEQARVGLMGLAEPLEWMHRAGAGALGSRPPDADLLPEMRRVRDHVVRDRVRGHMERLGVTQGLADEVRIEVGKMAALFDSALERFRSFARGGSRGDFVEAASAFRKDFLKSVFRLNGVAPSALKPQVGDLAAAGREVDRLLSGPEESDTESVEAAFEEARRAREKFLEALENWSKPAGGE